MNLQSPITNHRAPFRQSRIVGARSRGRILRLAAEQPIRGILALAFDEQGVRSVDHQARRHLLREPREVDDGKSRPTPSPRTHERRGEDQAACGEFLLLGVLVGDDPVAEGLHPRAQIESHCAFVRSSRSAAVAGEDLIGALEAAGTLAILLSAAGVGHLRAVPRTGTGVRLLKCGFRWSEIMSMADRDGYIWYDGKLVPWREATTHVLTHSLHYGLARVRGRARLQDGDRHRDLPPAGAHRAPVQLRAHLHDEDPVHRQTLMEAQREVVRANKLEACYIRPIAFYGSEKMGVSPKGARCTSRSPPGPGAPTSARRRSRKASA